MKRLCALLALLAPALVACGSAVDVIVRNGAGGELSAADIDRDPLALLPGNAVGIASLDATQLVASPFGSKLTALLASRLPLPASAGFEQTRDLSHVYLGVYSMQGADMVGVVSGNFDSAKIETAANGVDRTPLGTPVSKRSYAGYTLYTSANLGFCVLSPHTLLFGDQTGIRRALERVQERRLRRQTAPWMDKLLLEQKAPFAAGLDLRAQPIPDAARSNLRFLQGLETMALIGNFQDPGVNLAGTLVYGDETAAKQGADNVRNLSQTLSAYAPFLALLGIPQPVRKLSAEAKDKEASFVVGIDGAAVGVLLDKARDFLGAQP
ncbi:MAG TPA: hypothetical protein VGI10_01735 [Polyangiaceae bacterium]